MERRTIRDIIIAASISAVAFASSIFAVSNYADAAGSTAESKEWMKSISGEKYLSELAIPGTHDSGALYSIADLAGKCQDVTIPTQLNFGVRFLDIRLDYRGGSFAVTHGIVDERNNLSNIITNVTDFLSDHPSETVIMSIKNESGNDEDAFTTSLESAIKGDESNWYFGTTIPTLAQARGKMVLLSRYKNNSIGINLYNEWKDNSTFNINVEGGVFHIQDQYNIPNPDTKWAAVEECLKYSENNTIKSTFTINYLSGVLDSGFPPSYSVPIAKELNPLFLNNTTQYHKVGTVMFDFVNEELASSVYKRN